MGNGKDCWCKYSCVCEKERRRQNKLNFKIIFLFSPAQDSQKMSSFLKSTEIVSKIYYGIAIRKVQISSTGSL